MTYTESFNIPKDIFRAYDIRGIVDETFTPNNIYTIGISIGSESIRRGENTVIIGRDGRLSGPSLLKALSAGLMKSGCNVVNLGEVTTPILYYASSTLGPRSAVMLTGSHNPPNYNGLKIILAGETLYGDAIYSLHDRISKKEFSYGSGKESNKDIIDEYIKRVVSDIKLTKKLKVVIDCGNGVGGKVAPKLFRGLNCDLIELFCEVDGNFPNHHPDPTVEKNLVDLINSVKANNADIGLAFDGDADRVGIVTNKGEIIPADRLLMLFALDLLTRHPGEIIAYDVKCTRNLGEQITKHGGIPLMVQTGHSLVKAKMKEVGALLAGEFSGHTFIKERWYGFDDGIYTAARFLELLAKDTRTASEIFGALPDSIHTPELKIAIPEERKFVFVEKFQKNSDFLGAKTTTIDGVRADFPDGFGLVRASNTTPYIILRFEGDTKEALAKIQKAFKERLLELDSSLEIPF